MPTLELTLVEPVYTALERIAQQRNQPIEEIVQAALNAFLRTSWREVAEADWLSTTADGSLRRAKIHAEAEAWRAMSEAVRRSYGDEFVAVHRGQVIDHDADRLSLYRRVREQLGNVPVLITPAGEPSPREFHIISPHYVDRV